MQKEPKHTMHWFRRGLRLHDNPSLLEGIIGSTTFRCIFILDPVYRGTSDAGINKWRFLLESLEDLDQNLRQLNSKLFVIRGQPLEVFPILFKEWEINCLTYEEDPEPFAKVRDGFINTLCNELGVAVISYPSHTLFPLEEIIERNGDKIPLTYQQFLNIVKDMKPPERPVSKLTLNEIGHSYTPFVKNYNKFYKLPNIRDLGFNCEALPSPVWRGGENEAKSRLKRYLEKKSQISSTSNVKPSINLDSLLASPTGLSPYLRFGCLSVRLFYSELQKLYERTTKSTPPLSLHGQLLWREFFYCISSRNVYFDQMKNNPICVQIPWEKNSEALAKWANGQTGYPWIDAIMVQLREEGWIHLMARQAVVCFLTRGDLWISWEDGMKVFDELLLDADWSLNAGMWMWLSCSSFFKEFFHCYCPIKFGRTADPNGVYIKKYLPVLKNIPTQYIHEPWNAPITVQQEVDCVIGSQYPLPMVDHKAVSRINVARMRQIYQHLSSIKKSGDDEEHNMYK